MSEFKIIKDEFLFKHDQYFNECHASTVLPLENGKVLASWFAGSKEGKDDVSIWLGIREQGEWTAREVFKIRQKPHFNPVLFLDQENAINLVFKVGKKVPVWKSYIAKSDDEGLTWTEPVELVEGDESGGRGPVRCKPIYNKQQALLCPASFETETVWQSFIDISDDGCKSLAKAMIPMNFEKIINKGMIQPTLWLGKGAKVHTLMRSTEGVIYRSDSNDHGATWCEAYKTELPNNNSGIDLVALDDGKLVLIYNPVNENWGARTPISLIVSDDNGHTWHSKYDLDQTDGELSYPAMIAKGNKLSITYTYLRKCIRYFEIEVR